MTTFEEWRVTGDPGDDYPPYWARPHLDGNDADLVLHCVRCGWEAEPDPLTLAELNQRADEHTEVCR